jgi:hypothetical protein
MPMGVPKAPLVSKARAVALRSENGCNSTPMILPRSFSPHALSKVCDLASSILSAGGDCVCRQSLNRLDLARLVSTPQPIEVAIPSQCLSTGRGTSSTKCLRHSLTSSMYR